MSGPTPPRPPRPQQSVIITSSKTIGNGDLRHSLASLGYKARDEVMAIRKTIISSGGLSDSGKTEFICSAPGPGVVLCIDRNFQGMLDNPEPPAARQSDFLFKVISIPLYIQGRQEDFVEYWKRIRKDFYDTLDVQGLRTLGFDGDSDSYELQRLAAFGKLQGVPSINYTEVNAARRAFIARAHDSGKIVICTNKLKPIYMDKINPQTGQVEIADSGRPIRIPSGEYEFKGFEDSDYLWQIVIHHMYKAPYMHPVLKKMTEPQWGLKITKCKPRKALEGHELWGSDCNFAGLVQYVYPNIPLGEWFT